MAKLPKFTLEHNKRTDKWDLSKNSTKETVKSFNTKHAATKGGVLKKAVGAKGGSIRIRKENGEFQEERTFPRKRDPRSSPG